MRVIIAGSRDIDDYDVLLQAIKLSKFDITSIISGHALGVDTLGEIYAKNNDIPLSIFKADWNTYSKKAGYLRNVEMAENADALLAIHNGKSRGTQHMIKIAHNKELISYVHLDKISSELFSTDLESKLIFRLDKGILTIAIDDFEMGCIPSASFELSTYVVSKLYHQIARQLNRPKVDKLELRIYDHVSRNSTLLASICFDCIDDNLMYFDVGLCGNKPIRFIVDNILELKKLSVMLKYYLTTKESG